MDDKPDTGMEALIESPAEMARFAESYASFNRIINSLQRKYLELKEEFTSQSHRLAETSQQLVEMTRRNLSVTEFLNGILTSVPVGVIAVDQNGKVTHFNPAASRLLGIPAGDPPGKLYRDIVPPGNPVDANALRAVETGHLFESSEKWLDLPDGTRLQVSVSTALLRDAENRPAGAVEVFQDLTRIKQMEQELTRLNTLAALGEMAATIAHEVRNPLSGIGGFASLLKRDLPADDARQKIIDKIITGVESLNRTVTTLLNYTRFDEVSKESTRYDDFLRRTIEQFRHDYAEVGARLPITLHPVQPQDADAKLMIDPLLLRQLFFNLFINATEACGDLCRLELVYRKLPRHAAAGRYGRRVLLGIDQTVVETTLTDNGPGIPAEHIEKIFAPFFTTRPDGTGLGLAVCWKIAKAHGGDIFAETLPTGGARFTLVIPTTMDHERMEKL